MLYVLLIHIFSAIYKSDCNTHFRTQQRYFYLLYFVYNTYCIFMKCIVYTRVYILSVYICRNGMYTYCRCYIYICFYKYFYFCYCQLVPSTNPTTTPTKGNTIYVEIIIIYIIWYLYHLILFILPSAINRTNKSSIKNSYRSNIYTNSI